MGAQISLTRDWCIDFRAYSFPKKRAENLYTNVSAALEKSPNQVGVFFVIAPWSDCLLASHSSAPRKKAARYLAQALFTRTTTSDIFLIPEYFGVSIPAPHFCGMAAGWRGGGCSLRAGWQRVGAEGGVVYAIGARPAYTKPFFPGFWIQRFFPAVLARRGFSFVGAGNLLFYRCDGFPSPAAVAAAAKQTWARRFL